MSKKVDHVVYEKEEKKLQNELPSGNPLSDDVNNIKTGLDSEADVLDIDAELLKNNSDNLMLEQDSMEDFIHNQDTINMQMKAIPDENDFEETIVIPEISESAIKKAKEDTEKKKTEKKNAEKKQAKKNQFEKKPASEKTENQKSDQKKEAKKSSGKEKSSGKNPSAKNEKKTEPKKKKSKLPMIMGIGLGVIVIGVAGAYVGFAKYFESHYFFNTTINGRDFSMKTAEDAKAYMTEKVNDYELVLEESDGSTEKICGSDIGIKFDSEEELDQIIAEQNSWQFLQSLSHPADITTGMAVTIDDSLFKKILEELNCMDDENQKASKNAYPEFDENAGQYVIHPEEIGTRLKKDVFEDAVKEAILSFQDSLNVEEAGCYKNPKYTSESKKLKKCIKNLNKYLQAEITYDLSPEEVKVDASVIREWLSYDKKTLEVKFNEDKVKDFVENLAVDYNTVGKTRTFTGGDGQTYEVSGGAYGFAIDKETEYDNLLSNIKKGEVVFREPAYYQRGVSHGACDFGNTFAEVNLSQQHMYYIQDGETVMDSDVVTGIPVNGHNTPEGVYSVAWMQSPSILRGQNDDGSKYKTKVEYWMAFNYDIGFHDASWQPAFGGDRYTYAGSHGCVNMPTDAAGKLYGLISNGIPVIVHF